MRKRGVIGSPLNLFSLSSEYCVRVPPRLRMRLGVCNLRRTARYTAPTPLFNSVWWIGRPRTDSALKTPHTSPPCHPFVGVSSVIFPILFFSLPLYGGATHHLAELPDVRFVPKADTTLRSPDYLNCTWGERLRLAVLHLNSDAVDRLSGSVENPSEWLRRHVHDQTSLAVPFLNRLHDISVWRQFGTIWSKIVYRSLDLIEHKYRWPPMMMNRLFVVWLQGYLKHAKALVLEDDFVVLRSRRHRIQCWIPSRWIQIRTVIRHVTLASSVQRSEQYSSTRFE